MTIDNKHKPFSSSLLLALVMLSLLLGACEKMSPLAEQKTPDLAVNDKVQTQLFNVGWWYLEKNITDVADAANEPLWQPVQLPHTWNTTDTVDATPGYRRNASWYKKEFIGANQLRQLLYFEGANMETEVYVNGQLAGTNVGGFIGFSVDLTPHLKRGQRNELLVRVSNAYNPNLIPSQKSDFFIHGGIIRDVWLKNLPNTFVDKLSISTPSVSKAEAQTRVDIQLNSLLQETSSYRLNVQLISPQGIILQEKLLPETLVASAQALKTYQIHFETLVQPQLWSVDTPHLYSVKVQLLTLEGSVSHELSDRFGYRWFEMRPQQGFFVNGEKMLIRGTHRHEESAGLGAALPNEIHRRDMQMIKDMGANFVRLAHYPQDPEVYRAADELGLILWDELPWCRGGKGGAEWEKNTESYLQRQIAQNYNHPSIAFWSLGNEMYWDEDFPGGGADEKITAYVKKLNNLVKTQDSSRMTTLRKFYPAAAIVDVFSPSIFQST